MLSLSLLPPLSLTFSVLKCCKLGPQKVIIKGKVPGVMVHAYKPSTWKIEIEGSGV